MKVKAIAILLLLVYLSNAYAAHLERLFYLTADIADSSLSKEQLQQIKSHAKSIDILAPQIYQLDENGIIWGYLDPRVLTFSRENKIKIMPLITNSDFNQEKLHQFLQNTGAQERAIVEMVSLCKQYHFYGLQFDFENIHLNDKDAFSHFFQAAADRLHHNGFILSVAIIPHPTEVLNSTYDRWLFENWSGAYDYSLLGQNADFISLMSYDKHTSLTTPGPISASNWVEETIKNLLKVVPAEKISLGIPTYSGYWYTGESGQLIPEKYSYRSKITQISYSKVLSLLNEFQLTLLWQNQWKSSYVMYANHYKNEYLFVEDAKSFRAKLDLARHYQLRGISVWKLGLEDPEIWKVIHPD
ncbi:MAG: ydhD [Gammaproteobacteria bacterium]|jgi:spore germination protein YaaH|nr:ydhD [Gammaproteobacteria bacterium]